MPSWQDTVIIASGVTKKVFGSHVGTHTQAVPIAVWPQLNSEGERATIAIIRPTTDVHFGIDAVPTTSGPVSAKLASGTPYVFPLHPRVDTLFFLAAAGDTGPVEITWVVGRD